MDYKPTLKHFFEKKSDRIWHLSIRKCEVKKSAHTVLNEKLSRQRGKQIRADDERQ